MVVGGEGLDMRMRLLVGIEPRILLDIFALLGVVDLTLLRFSMCIPATWPGHKPEHPAMHTNGMAKT